MSRAEGIEKRHQRACRSHGGGRCNCRPSYRASVWDQRARQRIRETFQNLDEAKAWQSLCHALMASNEFIYVY